jgi:hypothetical protein
MTTRPKFTKAMFTRRVFSMATLLNKTSHNLIDGMWNPKFCASDASDYACVVIHELELQLKHLKKQCGYAAWRKQHRG